MLAHLPQEGPDADEVVALVEDAGRVTLDVPGNLTTEQACIDLVDATVRRFGRIDVLTVVAVEQRAYDSVMKTDVYALFWLVKAALPHMQPGSSIITTSSLPGLPALSQPGRLRQHEGSHQHRQQALAQQLGAKGIRVNTVAPGPVGTPLQVSGGQPPEDRPDFGGATPLGRPGQPAECAPAHVFLASAESSYVSGETLAVTGGTPTP